MPIATSQRLLSPGTALAVPRIKIKQAGKRSTKRASNILENSNISCIFYFGAILQE